MLGLPLFLFDVNDIVNIPSVLYTLLYADDYNVFHIGNNLDQIVDVMNAEMSMKFHNT